MPAMRNIFLPGADLSQAFVTIEGPDAHHLATVLRARPGERLVILDNRGGAAEAEIAEVGKRQVTVRLLGAAPVAQEPPVLITVAQALGKGDKFEQVVQHGTEAGASAFIPMVTERSVVKLDARSAEEKLARWSLIAKGAAEQSGRARIPAVEAVMSSREMTTRFGDYDLKLLLHPDAQLLSDHLANSSRPGTQHSMLNTPYSILVLVGPEGGFSPSEVELAIAGGANAARLGDHILRTETAALVAISQIQFAAAAGMVKEPGR